MNLSRKDCEAMKGFSILCIILHNILHCIYTQENEFTFNMDNFLEIQSFSTINIDTIFSYISFWGWYGVPVFIFLSGYGLSQKYEHIKSEPTSSGKFLLTHFLKLWCLLMPAFIVYLIIIAYNGATIWIRPTLAQSTMLINLIYSPTAIKPGVYWYFGLTLQLYATYYWCCYKKKNMYLILLVIVSVALMSVIIKEYGGDGEYLSYVRHNCVGWFMPFIIGIIYSRYAKTREKGIAYSIQAGGYLLSGLLLLWYCNYNVYTWLLTPVFSIVVIIAVVKLLFIHIHILYRCFTWLGHISSFLFVVHPLIREIVLTTNDTSISLGRLFVYLILSVTLSIIYKPIYTSLYSKISELVYRILYRLK